MSFLLVTNRKIRPSIGYGSLNLSPSIRIVIITSIVVAATASAISSKFGAFSRIGGIIGTSVSATFLIILGIMNIYILSKLIQSIRKLIASAPREEQTFEIKGAGCLFYLFQKIFKLVNRWDMSCVRVPLTTCMANCQFQSMENVSSRGHVWSRIRHLLGGRTVRYCIYSRGERHEYMAHPNIPGAVHGYDFMQKLPIVSH